MSIPEVDVGSIPIPPQEVEDTDQACPKIDLVGRIQACAAKLVAYYIEPWFWCAAL